MPKLYHHAGSWQLPGQQDKKAERVDVPGQPAELAAWLNSRRVPREGDAFDGLVPCNTAAHELLDELRQEEPETQLSGRFDGPRVAGFCDACGRSAAGSLKLAQGNDISTIEQWMETADLWAIQQLVERARDVVRGRSEALDGKGVQ
jgi:hypothetical protein